MSAALLVLGYAVALAWWVPGPLTRLTAGGISARLGLAAWAVAIVSVLTSTVSALLLLAEAAIRGWPGLAEAVCRSVAGRACAASVYRSAVFELALAVAAVIAAVGAAVAAWRYGRRVQRAQRHTRVHARAARITGRRLPEGALVLDDPQPAAYCVPGRPATIVLTSGALAVLDSEQLVAVLAHERAHLAGRHHLLLGLTRGLAVSFPAVPIFSHGSAEVARLAEMCADDAAARRTGRRTLLAALLTMGTGQTVPVAALPITALAVTAGAVAGRVQRLLEPPRHACQARNAAALITVTTVLALATGLVVAFAGPLAAHLIALA